MAKRMYTVLVDDIDGETEAAETIEFGLDGVRYEIDLSEANAMAMRGSLTTYIGAARMIGRAAGRRQRVLSDRGAR